MIKEICTLTLLLLPISAYAVSFDCSKASTSVEKLICSNPVLGKLDDVMSQNYNSMSAANIGEGAKKELRATQKSWLKERNSCLDRACLEQLYRKRLDEVCDYPVLEGAHPECTYSGEV
jgi:uncharacterized protein